MPSLKEGEALVHMQHLTVCGSDLLIYDRTRPEEEYPLAVGAPCHECFGTVEESRVDGVKPGQRVIALSGGLVEYAAVPARDIVPVADNVDGVIAPLCQPAGTVLYSVQQMGSILGKTAVVIGQGPIGLNFTDFLVRGGAVKVIGVDKHAYRLEASRHVGATHTIDATREDVVQTVREITDGQGTDIAVEACGHPDAFNQIFQCLHHQGLAVVFGLQHEPGPVPLDWQAMYERLPRMVATSSVRSGNRVNTVVAAADLVSQGRLDLTYQVTHQLPFEQVGQAFEMYSRKLDNSLKVVLAV